MPDRHLINTIRILLRDGERHKSVFVDRLYLSGVGPFGPCGDAACDAFEAACGEAEHTDPFEIVQHVFEPLFTEAERRGIPEEVLRPPKPKPAISTGLPGDCPWYEL